MSNGNGDSDSLRVWIIRAVIGVLAAATGALGGTVTASQETHKVEEQSERSDVILCQATNETRELLRGLVEGIIRAEDIPPNAEPGLRAYLTERNLTRPRIVASVRDHTRLIDCNTQLHRDKP